MLLINRVSEWCDLWGMKLNASTTNTMIVSMSGTMHPQSPPLTIGGTVLKESYDLIIFGVTFYSKLESTPTPNESHSHMRRYREAEAEDSNGGGRGPAPGGSVM